MSRLGGLIATISLIVIGATLLPTGTSDQALARQKTHPQKKKGQGGPKHVFTGPAPAHPFDVILARPTDRSITVSVLSEREREGFLSYGLEDEKTPKKTEVRKFTRGKPVEFALEGLKPDSRYVYSFQTREPNTREFAKDTEHSFQTQRPPGSKFRFAVQADSHLDQGTSPKVYERTLANALKDGPDFFIDLGDTFMTDKYSNHKDALPQYLAQRYYLGQIAHSTPLFLVLGNHDGERLDRFNGKDDCMPAWSCLTRKMYFPTPEPDAFYSGNKTPLKPMGRLANYYAYTWGDALFIALDPFWTTGRRGRDEPNGNWSRTLGEEQYRWLESTLTNFKAKFKFVFIHHLVGGIDESARGGLEAAGL